MHLWLNLKGAEKRNTRWMGGEKKCVYTHLHEKVFVVNYYRGDWLLHKQQLELRINMLEYGG